MTEQEAKEDVKALSEELFVINNLNSFLNDDRMEEMIERSLFVISRPMVPKEKAAALLVQYQAMSLYAKTCALSYGYNITDVVDAKERGARKGIYNSLSEHCDKMAQSLKYLVNL